ncbi:Imm8 family immunity protein [Sphingomonas sp. ST-64]|uniref:Imm8 family immunity protein n=1 Tax=Sphingomonas plantiphila TaxID=3163295 RepID=A0ABW8YLG9_9SPHN
MQAELRSLVTVYHEPLTTAYPSTEAFRISLRAMIGVAGEEGEESFDFDVCSPAWLDRELDDHPVVGGRFLLIVRDFKPAQIEGYVQKRIAHATGPDWPTIAEKLARWSQWEFEDYRG